MRPTLRALAEQQIVIEAQAKALDAIASRTGVDLSPFKLEANRRVARLRRTADEQNPANPIPEPAAQAAEITTQEAKTPAATTDVTSPMGVTLPNVGPAANTDVQGQGATVLDESLDLNEVEVTAPVQGTQTNDSANKVETEIVSQVDNPPTSDSMFPLDGGPFSEQQKVQGNARAFASLRLARLRIEAGILPSQDDVLLGQAIASDQTLSDAALNAEIQTLSQVVTASRRNQPVGPGARPGLVPRAASASAQPGDGRGVPSLVTSATVSQSMVPSSGVTDDEVIW
jgi:hypothetical protein